MAVTGVAHGPHGFGVSWCRRPAGATCTARRYSPGMRFWAWQVVGVCPFFINFAAYKATQWQNHGPLRAHAAWQQGAAGGQAA